ncbi:putative glycosyl transferase [Caulifigura coniformis]|uniref:Putative glycosyl transferase n=1 Tax=Caulifigura coniformis TaxID=2527983 RepID=A0A517SI81_9PLAN|nr:glycosyltransferase family 4 protein [Caulifigura coniformis]QDT55833.1 putative glycosyl transferase [Caulifigura coniformis]
MRVLLLCNSFGKGWAATAHLAAELAEGLADGGDAVEVLSSNATAQHEVRNNGGTVTVHKCNSFMNSGRLQRHLRELCLLMYFCGWALKCRARFDAVICLDSPRFCALAALIIRRRTGARCVAWVMDLPSEQVSRHQAGRAIASRISGLMHGLNMKLLRRMDALVTLGRCMADVLVRGGAAREKVHLIRTWADDEWSALRIDSEAARRKFGLRERVTIMYSGYAGQWHDFRTLCEAIRPFLQDETVQFVFAVSGPGLGEVQRLVEETSAKNVVLHDRVDRRDLPTFLACGDVHLASLAREMLGTCSPSKIYPVMVLGRPVAFLGPLASQAAMDVQRTGGGIAAETAEDLCHQLRLLVSDREARLAMGERAREAYLKDFSQSAGVAAWRAVLAASNCQPDHHSRDSC